MHFVNAKGILSASGGMNVYRGCTHGCIYCDSRSRCYHMDHEFTDIEVKQNAPELLEQALRRKREKCMIGTGAMCDPYLHCEEELKLTRRCLEIIDRHGFGLAIQTKSCRILRDMDLLQSIHQKAKCVVQMTLTTFDEDLCRMVEPNVSTTRERYEALKIFHKEGIPTVVWMTPILPFLNDTPQNVRGILEYCFDAGVKGVICFGMGLTLREGDREYYYQALDKHFPGLKQRYVRHFGLDYECPSPRAQELWKIFDEECRKHGVMHRTEDLFRWMHTLESKEKAQQISLFDL